MNKRPVIPNQSACGVQKQNITVRVPSSSALVVPLLSQPQRRDPMTAEACIARILQKDHKLRAEVPTMRVGPVRKAKCSLNGGGGGGV